MMAKAWMKQDQAPQAEALETWNTLEAEFNEERKAMLMASAESDKIKEEMNKKFGSGTVKYGSEIKQPEIKTPQAIFEFSQRNPAAEGGRAGFYKGMSAKKAPQNIKLETPKILEPIGYKKDGTPKYNTKAIRELDSNYLGKFEGKELDTVKKVLKSGTPGSIIDDSVEIRNVIISNKGNISSLEDLGNLADFKSGNKVDTKRVKAALAIAKDNFSEIGNFKFIPDRYKGIRSKEVRGLNMVVDAIKASQNSVPEEKLIHFLPDNMGFFYKAPGEATDIGRLLKKDEKPVKGNIAGKRKIYSANVYSDMYNLNKDQIKYITDRITEETGKSFTSKDYSNLVDEVKDFRGGVGQASRVAKVNAKTYKEIVDLANDNTIQNLLKGDLNRNTQIKLLDRATKLVDGDISTASRRLFQMAESMSDTTDQYKNLGIELNNNKASKIIATGKQLAGTSNRYAMSSVVYDYYGNVVDKALGATEGESFIGKYQTQIKNLLDKGQSPDEIFSLTASARRGMSPYAIFTQNLKTQVNSAIKGAYIDGALSRTHKKLQNIFKGKNYSQLDAKDKKAVNDLVETFEKTKADALKQPVNPTAVKNGAKPIYLTAAEKKNIQLPEFDLKNPPSKSIEDFATRFVKYPQIKEAFEKSYKDVGYSMKVTADMKTQKELIQAIGCPNFKAAGGGRAEFSKGGDCFDKGTKLINSGMKGASPAALKNLAKLGPMLLKAGSAAMSGLIVPEAVIVGLEAAARVNMGDTPSEAILRATDYLTPDSFFGDFMQKADLMKIERTLGKDVKNIAAQSFDRTNQSDEINKLEEKLKNLEAMTESGDFGYVGDLTNQINMTKNQIKEKKDKLKNTAQIGQENKDFYTQQALENAYDASMAKSKFAEKRLVDSQSENPRLNAAQAMQDMKSQEQLNKGLSMRLPLTGSKNETAFLNASQLPLGPRMPSDMDIIAAGANKRFKDMGSDKRVTSQDLKLNQDEKKFFKNASIEELVEMGIPLEAILGFNMAQPVERTGPGYMTNYKPLNRFGSQERPVLYPKGRGTLAEGGITGLRSKYEYKK